MEWKLLRLVEWKLLRLVEWKLLRLVEWKLLRLVEWKLLGWSSTKKLSSTRCPDKREIWHGERTFRGRNVGIQAPKLSKFRLLAINLPLGGHSFAQFLRNSHILYASLGGF